MSRKSRSITLSVSDFDKAKLEEISLEFGLKWGERPNISKLVEAIARGKLRLSKNYDWSGDRINTLNRILGLLKDEGHYTEALELSHLLLERSEINQPLRYEIQSWANNPGKSWRTEVNRYIRQHQPFCLTYQDAANRLWTFTVRHAAIVCHEDRQYLDCWCDETEGNQDLEALSHNWSLRLDRIPDEVGLSPAQGYWQSELSFINVELHLFHSLAFSYHSKTKADLENDWLPDQQIRRVIRRVQNTFWFLREIHRYGPDCLVIGPQELRVRFAEEISTIHKLYFGE